MARSNERMRPQRVLAGAWTSYRRAFLRNAAILLGISLAAGVLTIALLSFMPSLARMQLPLVLDDSGVGVSPGGFTLLLAQVAIPIGILTAALTAISQIALVRVIHGARAGARIGIGAALVHGLRHSPAAVAALLATLAAVALLAIATPFLMVLGALGLLATLIAKLAHRRLPVATWWFVAALIPFGAAAALAARWSLAVALIAFEGHGPIAGLSRSTAVTRRAPWSTGILLTVAFVAYFLLQAAVGLLSLTELPTIAATCISLLLQVCTFAFPIAVAVELARNLRGNEYPIVALPVLRRPLRVSATATIVAVTLIIGIGEYLPVRTAAPAHAVTSEETEGTDSIDAIADLPVAPPGDAPLQDLDEQNDADLLPPVEAMSAGEEAFAPQSLTFRPVLMAEEGEITAPGDPITLRIEASEADGGLIPYTFFFTAYLIDANDERVRLGSGQAAGGGREAGLFIDPTRHALGVGEHRFVVETQYRPSRDSDDIDGPEASYTHLVGMIDESTQVLLTAAKTEFIADETVQLQATVTGDGGPVPTGTVTFQRTGDFDPSPITVNVDGDGIAQTTLSGLAVGEHTFEAVYRFAPHGVIAGSNPLTLTSLPYPVELVLQGTSGSSAVGQVVDVLFVLSANRGGTPRSGAVELLRAGEVLHRVELTPADFTGSEYHGTLTTDQLVLGANELTAVFSSGDGQHQPATSNAITHNVNAISATLSIASNQGWSLPRGGETNVRVALTLPADAVAPKEGHLLVTFSGVDAANLPGALWCDQNAGTSVDSIKCEIPLDEHFTFADFTLRDLHANATIHVALMGVNTHNADPVTSDIEMRAAQTRIAIYPVGAALPGETQQFMARVDGETSLAPVDGTLQVRLQGTQAWTTFTLDPAEQLRFEYVLGVGEHILEARYFTAQPNEFTDAEATEPFFVGYVSTTLSVTGPGAQPRVAEDYSVTVQAQSVGWPAHPGGQVTAERANGEVLARATLSSVGSATLEIPGTAVGNDSLLIRYLGSSTHSSAAETLTVPVRLWPVTVTIADTPADWIAGETGEFLATITSDVPAEVAALSGGQVEFSVDGSALGIATVAADGSARIAAQAPASAGPHTVKARFLGVAGAVAEATEQRAFSAVVAPTSVNIEVAPNTIVSRGYVEINVQVTADPRSPFSVAGGTVTLSGTLLGSQQSRTLDANGTANFSVIAPLAEGSNFDLEAIYLGSDQFDGSSTSKSVRVDAAPVELTVSGTDRIVAGEQTMVTVQMRTTASTSIPTAGVLELFAGTTLVGSRTLAQGDGSALTFTVAAPSPLPIGNYELTAKLRSSFGYLPSTSAAKPFTVLGRETEVRLVVEPSGSSPRDTAFTATARVDIVWSSDQPRGQVWLRNGDSVLRTVSLSSFDGDRGVATFTIDDLPIGAYDLHAEYLPIGNMNAPSVSTAIRHEVTGRPVTLIPHFGALNVGKDATVTVDVRDPNAADGSPPNGDVDILLDGAVIGTAPVIPGVGGSLTSQATVTLPFWRLIGGEQDFTVSYRSFGGTHSFAEQTVMVPVGQLTPSVTVRTISDVSALKWGDAFDVRVAVTRSSAAGANMLPPPSGTVTVSLADGSACTPHGIDYRCEAARPGHVRVTAEVSGDANYVASRQNLDIGSATKRLPQLDVSLNTFVATVETGTQLQLDWNLNGPGTRPAIVLGTQTAVCNGTETGTCQFSYGLAQADKTQHIEVAFAGNSHWEPVSWQQTLTPIGCYPLTLRVEPWGSGTLAVASTDGQACANGNYRAGTRIGVKPTPADTGNPSSAYRLDSVNERKADSAVSGLFWFTVGAGGSHTTEIVARFGHKTVCYPVALQDIGIGGRYLGTALLDQLPNCPGRIWYEPVSSPQVEGQRTSTVVGWYQAGTLLTPRASTFNGGEFYSARMAADNTAAVNATSWQSSMPRAFTVSEAVRIQARFGVPCLPVTLTTEGPGRVDRLTQPNCADELRSGQYELGTEVLWRATPDSEQHAYVDRAVGVVDHRVSDRVANARLGIADYVVLAFPEQRAAQLSFNQCHELTIQNLTPSISSAEASISNCPVGSEPDEGTWRYRAGTEVEIRAELLSGLHYVRPTFSTWNFPSSSADPVIAAQNVKQWSSFTITEPTTLRPAFINPGQCAPLTVSSADAGVEVQVSHSSDALTLCQEGTLLDGWNGDSLAGQMSQGTLIAEARATEGDPKLGWTVTGIGTGVLPSAGTGTPGNTLRLSGGGDRVLTAHACQAVSSYIGLTDTAGDVALAKQYDGSFIEITPAPNCPFSATAWLIGTELSITAAADDRGYEFGGWGGVAVPDATDSRTASYVVDRSAPVVPVTASYAVVCHTLTINGKAHRVTTVPEPNCPGAPAGALSDDNVFTGQYIGGTAVALFGEVPGGNIWQGWQGDLVETGKVKVAVAVMDDDKTATHRYRGKSWDEKAGDFFTEAGNQLAVAAKKALGGAAFVAGLMIQEVPPFSFVGEAFEVLSLVGDVLAFIGVPESVTKYFDYPQQSLGWVLSGFNCLASAGLSSQGSKHSEDLSGVADSNQNAVNSAGGHVFRAIGIDPGDDNELVGEALEKLYVTGKIVGYATKYTGVGGGVSKAMDTIDVGLDVYGIATGPQGVGWDDSAADAWDKDMGSHIAGCIAAATPDFLRGTLPISEKNFDRYEEEYGL